MQSNPVSRYKSLQRLLNSSGRRATYTLRSYLSLLEYHKHLYEGSKYVIVDALATGWWLPVPDFSKRSRSEMYIHNDEIA